MGYFCGKKAFYFEIEHLFGCEIHKSVSKTNAASAAVQRPKVTAAAVRGVRVLRWLESLEQVCGGGDRPKPIVICCGMEHFHFASIAFWRRPLQPGARRDSPRLRGIAQRASRTGTFRLHVET